MADPQNSKKYDIARLFQELGLILKQNMRKEFEDLDLTMPQTMVIGTLIHHGKMKVSALSEKLGFTNSTTSGILDRLEKQGIILRERSPDDRRVVYVSIAEPFSKKHMDFADRLKHTFENLLQDATDDELNQILNGLMTLKTVLATQQKSEDQTTEPPINPPIDSPVNPQKEPSDL
jgi:DNA-binding MarR family transcriptional regulator